MAQTKEELKILLTGGHLTPALAVLAEMQSRGFRNFVWAGHKFAQTSSSAVSPEYQIVTNRGVKFIPIISGKIWRKWTLKTFVKGLYNLLLIPYGFGQAFVIIWREKPSLIISFGGYLAVPIIIAGKLLGAKIVTHEQTVILGLANKIIARLAQRIYVSWPNSLNHFPKHKVLLTGNPIRPEVLAATTSRYNFHNQKPVIYVTGGNQGANTINWRLSKILLAVLKHANIIHQTGNSTLTKDYEQALATKKLLPPKLSESYIVAASIFGPEIGEIFAKSDLIIARAGANTITEILALGKRAILIPIPWTSHNEQEANAQMVVETGLGLMLKQYDAMPPEEVLAAIEKGLAAIAKSEDFLGKPLANAQQTASKLIVKDAQQRIVDDIESLLQI